MTTPQDLLDRLHRLEELLAAHGAASAMDIGDATTDPEATLVHNLIGGIAVDRLRVLSTEVATRAGATIVDPVDAVAMRLVLDSYHDGVRRLRGAVRLTNEMLRRCTAELREARRICHRRTHELHSGR